jgi:serpin B
MTKSKRCLTAIRRILILGTVLNLGAGCDSPPAPLEPPALTASPQGASPNETTPVSATNPPDEAVFIPEPLGTTKRNLEPQADQADIAALSQGLNAFAFDLYHQIPKTDKNLVLAPISISTALSAVLLGAGGETESQMLDTLHITLDRERYHEALNQLSLALDPLEDPDETRYTFDLANSLWGQQDYPFRPEFLNDLALNYQAGLRPVDFIAPEAREEARQAINAWTRQATQGLIDKLVPPDVLNDQTRLVLANAVYLKAEWLIPFPGGSGPAPFIRLDGTTTTVTMMSRRSPTPNFSGPGFEVAELQFADSLNSMLIVVPDSGTFEAFEATWTPDLLRLILANISATDLKLFMPQFTFDSQIDLGQVLGTLGMPDAFNTSLADFRGIGLPDAPALHLSHVLHQSTIAVDEIGVEAAGVTTVVAEFVSLPKTIVVDRPFLFVVLDREHDVILFMGRVMDPGPLDG